MSNLCEEMWFQAEVFEQTVTDSRNSAYPLARLELELKVRSKAILDYLDTFEALLS